MAQTRFGSLFWRLGLGKALEKLGRDGEAVTEFQEAIRLDPTQAEAHYLLGRTYQKLKRMTESQKEVQMAQRLQAEKRAEHESLLKAAGERGDPARGLGLVPLPEKQTGADKE